MAKISDVISFELLRTVRKRTFWFATLAPLVIIIVVYGISYISNRNAAQSAQQAAQTITQKSKVGLRDDSGIITARQLATLHVTQEPSKDSGIAAVKSGALDAFIYYPKDVTQNGASVYSQYKGISFSQPYDTAASQLLKSAALATVKSTIHNGQVASILQKDPSISNVTYKNGQETAGIADIIWPGVIALTFLMLVVLLSYVALSTTTEEKENRAAEMLLTTIRARTLILGKITTVLILGIIQLLTIVVPVIVGYIIFRNHISLPANLSLGQIPFNVEAVILGVLFAFGGFVLFTAVLVSFGCLFPNATEANRFLGVAILWAFIPIYTLTYIISSPDAFVVKVFAYFPLTAPTTNLIKNAVGALTIGGAILPLIIVYASAALAIAFGVNAFRYSAMEYGRRVSVKEILRKIAQ